MKKLLPVAFILMYLGAEGQSTYQPYSHQSYQKLSPILYGSQTRIHTAIKPLIPDSILHIVFDSLLHIHGNHRTTWAGRKLWQEHLVEVKRGDNLFYADFLPDFEVGRTNSKDQSTVWLNRKGVQVGGHIGKKFSFYANYTFSNAQFPGYVAEYINGRGVIPGEAGTVYIDGNKHRWSNGTANVSFTPTKYLNVSVGYDKNFIGDGYRSLLLSDVSPNYVTTKLTGTLGNVRYLSLWAYMRDPFATSYENRTAIDGVINDGAGANLFKWGAFQYIDWNVSNRLSIGFFQSVLWAPKNTAGRRGFDFNYISPLIFLRSVELTNTASPDKMHLGLNTKYKVLDNLSVYGQFLLSELTVKELFAGNGYIHNKYGFQLGMRGHDLFGVSRLNYLTEYNTVRPYTYQHFNPITAYTNYNQPLAHPLGANFREGVGLVNYSYRQIDFQIQGNWALYGSDSNEETNNGGDLRKPYTNYLRDYGNAIGQGIVTHTTYVSFKTAYLINPSYNLRIELAMANRRTSNIHSTDNTRLIHVGIRSSFRNVYHDF